MRDESKYTFEIAVTATRVGESIEDGDTFVEKIEVYSTEGESEAEYMAEWELTDKYYTLGYNEVHLSTISCYVSEA